MRTQTRRSKVKTHVVTTTHISSEVLFPLSAKVTLRAVQYFGMVNYATTERVIEEIQYLYEQDPLAPIYITVTSAGGPTGTAMSFFDHINCVLKPQLISIGSGDVDSSGMIIFLSAGRRYVTKNTTALLHKAGRIFETDKRITAKELEAMWKEDTLKDFQYATIVSEKTNGRLSTEEVLRLMEENTLLSPADMVAFGLAEGVLN